MIGVLALSILWLSGCQKSQNTSTKAKEANAQADKKESEKNPTKLVFSFQKQKDPKKVKETAELVSKKLSKDLGLPVEVMIPSSYGASVQALVSNHAQVAYMSSIPFLLAKSEAPVRPLLVEERADKTFYHSIFVVKKDSPYKTLHDLKNKRMMFTSPTSTSGYVMAYSRLVDEKILAPQQSPKDFFSEVRFAGGYDRALLSVLNGQADACAVSDYTMVGKKADIYLSEEQRDQLRILTRTPGVPTHLIAIRDDLPAQLQSKLKSALLKISQERPELLADVYGAAKFVEVNEDIHLKGAVNALANTGLDKKKLVK